MTHSAEPADANDARPGIQKVAEADLRQMHVRMLVDALVARAGELRTLHEQYYALPPEQASSERREKLLQLLLTEQAVLEESLRLQEQLDAAMRARRARMLRLHGFKEAPRLPR